MRTFYNGFIAFIVIIIASQAMPGSGARIDVKPGSWQRNIRVEYEYEGQKSFNRIQIYFPKMFSSDAPARTLIVLHGWRQNPSDWENYTPITKYADRYNIVLVCPAMSTTLYESQYFPETAGKWAPIPGGVYISGVLVDFLKKRYHLAAGRGRTGIFGISTGGRGAILLAAQHPKLFGAAASLSGDFDSASIKDDRLLVAMYGPYVLFTDRWEKEVNIIKMADRLKNTPVFLGHGTRDAVVPPPQTAMLADRLKELKKKKGGFDVECDTAKSLNAGHDWAYWGSLVPEVLKFFDERLKK